MNDAFKRGFVKAAGQYGIDTHTAAYLYKISLDEFMNNIKESIPPVVSIGQKLQQAGSKSYLGKFFNPNSLTLSMNPGEQGFFNKATTMLPPGMRDRANTYVNHAVAQSPQAHSEMAGIAGTGLKAAAPAMARFGGTVSGLAAGAGSMLTGVGEAGAIYGLGRSAIHEAGEAKPGYFSDQMKGENADNMLNYKNSFLQNTSHPAATLLNTRNTLRELPGLGMDILKGYGKNMWDSGKLMMHQLGNRISGSNNLWQQQ